MKIGRSHPTARWDAQAGGSCCTLPMISGYDNIRDGMGERPSFEFDVVSCPPAGMINLSLFMNWLQPPNFSCEAQSNILKNSSKSLEEDHVSEEHSSQRSSTCVEEYSDGTVEHEERGRGNKPPQCCEPYQLPSLGLRSGHSKSVVSALSALSRSSMFARMEQGLNTSKGPETVERRVIESATAALAAALSMDDCKQSEEEEMTCSLYQNSVNGVVLSSFLRAEAPALAAALGMDNCVQLSQEVESASGFMGQNNSQQADVHYTSMQADLETPSRSNNCSGDYGIGANTEHTHTHPLITLPLPPVPYTMDQSLYLSDHISGLWNTFEPPPSGISMGMIF
ncbi:hypothetical protein L7F22_047434 [Adiantum nelumboides]|nr:hypothetical protein [Adiantum nelumboides]